jgi:hypothetical protein
MERLKKICFICGASDSDGIILNGERICKSCEEKLINTTVINDNYSVYKDKIKIVLFNERVLW